MKRLLTAAAVLSLLAAGAPAVADSRHSACKGKAGGVVVKPGKPYEAGVPTPVGAGAGLVTDSTEDVAAFYLDLQGKPSGAKGKLELTLTWDNPVSDYDLVVAGVNELSGANPEVFTTKVSHCKPVRVGVDVFVGVPVDELTLTVKGS